MDEDVVNEMSKYSELEMKDDRGEVLQEGFTRLFFIFKVF